MKRTIILIQSFIIGISLYSQTPLCQKDNPEWVIKGIKTVEAQALSQLDDVLNTKKLPRSEERGLTDTNNWTSGFYPGILWYIYEYTNDSFWKFKADTITRFLEKEQYNKNDHDIGFRISCSYGKGFEITNNKEYKNIIIQSAYSFSTRYNKKIKAIQSWEAKTKRDWKFPVIIDNMMNLELLYQAASLSGNKDFKTIAYNHALTTMNNHFRNDYSCPHVVDYDPESGKMRKYDYNNGFSDPQTATWSRGQGWALYGYTLMYRYTEDKIFLKHAENIAKMIINHPNLPKDMIPYWDFNSPKIPTARDSSAGAIYASALLELSTYPTDSSELFFSTAEKILRTLSSDKYLAKIGENGYYAIKHATGNFLSNSELDNTLIYADYYYIEALIRYIKITHKYNLF